MWQSSEEKNTRIENFEVEKLTENLCPFGTPRIIRAGAPDKAA